MTNDEKAKAYDEAINQAKKELQTCGSLNCDAAKQIFRLFPELAESEDERIRNAIIGALRDTAIAGYGGVSVEDMVGYLENQKEATCFGELMYKLSAKEQEVLINAWPKNPVPTVWTEAEIAAIINDSGMSTKTKVNLLKPREPIPADCASDAKCERIREILLDSFEKANCSKVDELTDCRLNKADVLAYLERQKEQKPTEWSEEDEKDMAHIIRILDDCYAYGKHDLSKTDHENFVNKLKSLRPSWKPSEEQIHAIVEALKYLPNNKYEWMILNTLVDVFKKLM